MFDETFVKSLAKAVAAEIVDMGRVAPRLLSLDQAAAYLGMTPDALRYKATMGQVPAVRADKKWRFDKPDLDQWIQEHKRVA